MPDELFGVPIWWIGNNRFGACRYLRLCQEVSDEIQIAVIDDVGAANGVAVGAQNVDDGASTSRGFPYAARQALNTQQCFHRGGRRLVTIETFADRSVVEQTLIDAKLRHVRTEKRKFQFQYTQEDYLTGLEIWATGRFVKEMLGDAGWPAFQERVRATFAERFSDPLNDFRDVILAIGTKP